MELVYDTEWMEWTMWYKPLFSAHTIVPEVAFSIMHWTSMFRRNEKGYATYGDIYETIPNKVIQEDTFIWDIPFEECWYDNWIEYEIIRFELA